MILQIALILPVPISASLVAIVTAIGLPRLMGDILPVLSASAFLMGLTLATAFPEGSPWPLAIAVLTSHGIAFLAIRQTDKRRGP